MSCHQIFAAGVLLVQVNPSGEVFTKPVKTPATLAYPTPTNKPLAYSMESICQPAGIDSVQEIPS